MKSCLRETSNASYSAMAAAAAAAAAAGEVELPTVDISFVVWGARDGDSIRTLQVDIGMPAIFFVRTSSEERNAACDIGYVL
jgi:hypothetical protein